MMKFFRSMLICLLFTTGQSLFCSSSLLPDTTGIEESETKQASISIKSNLNGLLVYIDTCYIGTVPIDSVQVATGYHIIKFIHPENRNWSFQTVAETLSLKESEHIHYNIQYPYLYRISTIPYNATVVVGDSIYGTTPLIIRASSDSINISIFKEGYRKITLNPISDIIKSDFILEQEKNSPQLRGSEYLLNIESKSYTPIYLSTFMTVSAGAVSAYCKIKADKYYNDYQRTGSEASLRDVHRFDRMSAISLIVAEIGFFMLSYLLFSQ